MTCIYFPTRTQAETFLTTKAADSAADLAQIQATIAASDAEPTYIALDQGPCVFWSTGIVFSDGQAGNVAYGV